MAAAARRPPVSPRLRKVLAVAPFPAHDRPLRAGRLPGTLTASLGFFPAPRATLVEAAKAMLAEPNGCFEQTWSTNYPNVMVAGYLKKAGNVDPETTENLDGLLDRGHKRLAGYESQNKGYEWFGGDPGHEALTAWAFSSSSIESRGSAPRAVLSRRNGSSMS